jgi:hypothetical protein
MLAQNMIFDEKTFVLGVGAGKSGTTWLYGYLSEREDIFMPSRKELHYFDTKYRPDTVGGVRRRLLDEWTRADTQSDERNGPTSSHEDAVYRDFFRRRVPKNVNLFGEITPGYAVIGELGFRKIRELFRTIRIIFLMRDPVERFYSHVRMNRNKRMTKSMPPKDIASTIDNPRYTELSAYENTIRDLEAVFKPHELIYLFYETLFRDETVGKLCALLGVEYRPADFGEVAKSGGTHDPVPPEVHQRFVEKFRPTYRFCREKFGPDLPEQWNDGADR